MSVDRYSVLDDRYALDEVIGRGGMADVYRATDQLLLRPVAVKVLREISEPGQRERFIAEARTLASLSHPSLITLLDAGILADRPYLVMELATGPSLSACIEEGPVEPARVRSIGRQLAEGLAYAHDQGVVHRDIKPSNVLLCDDERVLLADFGIATLVGGVEHHTRTGDTIGSPAYLAPEQVSGGVVGPAADVYSLGLVILEALTAVRSYTGSPIEAAMARLQVAPAIPTHLDPAWSSLIARMTRREPADRPTAAEVAAELGEPVAVAPTDDQASIATGELELTDAPARSANRRRASRAARATTRSPRRRIWAAALASMLTAGALVAVLVMAPWNPAQKTDSKSVVPAGVPTRLQGPLSDLHDAVEGHPR